MKWHVLLLMVLHLSHQVHHYYLCVLALQAKPCGHQQLGQPLTIHSGQWCCWLLWIQPHC
jgi:hypothetical protein